jgi:TolA-binding protein
VEAFHERRLGGTDGAALERHLAQCADCENELAALRRLRQDLRELPVPFVDDDVTGRRQRQVLLAAAYQPPTDRRRVRAARVASLATAALVVLGVVVWSPGAHLGGTAHRTIAVAPQPLRTEIVAAGGTRWSRHRTAAVERVELAEGELAVEVHRADPSQRFVIAVPDGEIEDIGTRFLVTVNGGSTRQIVVREGTVIFRRGQKPALHIDAPTTWTDAAPPPPRSGTPSKDPTRANQGAEISARRTAALGRRSSAGESTVTAADLLARANQARREGDHARAITLHRWLQDAFPSSREAHASLGIMGRLLLDDGDAGSALASFDAYRARGRGPLDESVLAGRALSLERLARIDEARAAWRALLVSFPDTPYGDHARLRVGVATAR